MLKTLEGAAIRTNFFTVDSRHTAVTDKKPLTNTFGPNKVRHSRIDDKKRMIVDNGRLLATCYSLDENGFVIVERKTNVANFFNFEQLKTVSYTEVEQPINQMLGASLVWQYRMVFLNIGFFDILGGVDY